MTTFLFIGKYSSQGVREASARRTQKMLETVMESGGRVASMYALLGVYDLLLVTEFEDVQAAMKASLKLNKSTGISFTTLPAVTVAEFDKMLDESAGAPDWK
jgi:uncharacterized protein with GYD domain